MTDHPARGRRRFIAASAAAVVLAPTVARAQKSWPEKQVKIIIPFAPGGPSDVTARIVLAKALAELGQSALFDNKAGASGMIGAEVFKSAPRDNHTFFAVTTGILCITHHLQPVPFDADNDFIPVARTATAWTGMAVHPSLPVSNVAEFVAYARANPGKINFGSPGQATLFHIVGEMLNVEAGIQMTNVPYKGSAPALQDLVAGQIQVQFDPGTLPLIADGRLKGLAVIGDKRWPRKPEIPTLKEQGYAKTGGESWHGVVAIKDTPPSVVDALSKAIEGALRSPEVVEKLANVQHFASYLPSEPFREKIVQERKMYGDVIQKANIKV
ncbi:MAG: tripartite tricarboxylate transporter substrate binding protein [Enhydrobacter sp.]|nr:tripartite tricarboxylate transporter substrate binding protein [Enhydrobacter sp.]